MVQHVLPIQNEWAAAEKWCKSAEMTNTHLHPHEADTHTLSFWVSNVCTLYPAQTRVTVKHRRVFPSLKPEIGFPSCCWLSFTLSETGAATPRQNLSTSVRARVHVPSHIHLCYNAHSIWKEIWYLLARLDWCTEAVSCSTRRDVFPAS